VLGARIPVVIPARSDSMEVRMASCVLASLASSGASGTSPNQAGAVGSSIAAVAA